MSHETPTGRPTPSTILKEGVDRWELPGMALHSLMDRLREDGPLVPVRFMGAKSWLTTEHEVLAQAFADSVQLPPERAYQIGIKPLIGENFQSMSGAQHRLFRGLATPMFRPRKIERMDSTVLADAAHELIDSFIHDGHADLVPQFTERYPHIVIARLLGLPRDQEDQFSRWVVGILDFTGNPQRALQCRDELWAYLDPVIEARTHEPQDDVISQLIHAHSGETRMTRDQVKSHVALMFSAGSATTHDSIGNLIYALATTGDCWRQVAEDPSLRDGAIEELLRWEPAISFLPRISRSDAPVEIGGVRVEPDTFVLMGVAAGNHDPKVYDDPHRFDIRRTSAEKLTFGHGERSCPGMHLARKEIRVTLDALLERLPALELQSLEQCAPTGTIFRTPRELRCRF